MLFLDNFYFKKSENLGKKFRIKNNTEKNL